MANSLRNFLSKFTSKSKDIEDESKNESSTAIRKDKNSLDPNAAWRERKKHQCYKKLTPLDPGEPCKKGRVRFVCISDTHTILEKQGQDGLAIPDGDVLLHTGDFTMYGTPDEVALVNSYLGTLPHKYKIVIAGNHDVTFDLDLVDRIRSTRVWKLTEDNYEGRLKSYGAKTVRDMLTNCIYLQDSMVKVYGINIYGAPWQPGSGSWGFNRRRGTEILEKWNQIPEETDILLTHGPPCGHGDDVGAGILQKVFDPRDKSTGFLKPVKFSNHVGCVDLLNTIQRRVKPKYHVFGHIHEGYGSTSDGMTTFINAATCDEAYKAINPPIVFDMPIPKSQSPSSDYSEFEWVIHTTLPHKDSLSDSDSDSDNNDDDDDDVWFTDAQDTAEKSQITSRINDITEVYKTRTNLPQKHKTVSEESDDDDDDNVCFTDTQETAVNNKVTSHIYDKTEVFKKPTNLPQKHKTDSEESDDEEDDDENNDDHGNDEINDDGMFPGTLKTGKTCITSHINDITSENTQITSKVNDTTEISKARIDLPHKHETVGEIIDADDAMFTNT